MNPRLIDVVNRHGISLDDFNLALTYLGSPLRPCDLVLAPDGKPYLYRWHLVPRNLHGNVYFHIQVASDPERPLHDHPWDNISVILAGTYRETYALRLNYAEHGAEHVRDVCAGETVFREAEMLHRLVLPEGVPYTMTLFTTGPKIRDWGFWYPHGWVHNERVVRTANGVSIHEELKA